MPVYIQKQNSLDDDKPITFISKKFAGTLCIYGALVREAITIHISVQSLSLYLHDVECVSTNWYKILNGKQNNYVNNLSIELSLFKLIIQYRTVLADCLSTLIDENLTNCDDETKGQEFECSLFDEYSPYLKCRPLPPNRIQTLYQYTYYRMIRQQNIKTFHHTEPRYT